MENPQKTDNGRLIYGYECDTRTADAEFLLSKRQYINLTGRQRGADDVIAYHLRQSFMPGEITPEKSNEIGRELALKLTKGNNAFIVCTHIDRHHVHNHIIINSVDLDCIRKFRNFWGSTWAIRRMNDKLCLEHGLSIVENPKAIRFIRTDLILEVTHDLLVIEETILFRVVCHTIRFIDRILFSNLSSAFLLRFGLFLRGKDFIILVGLHRGSLVRENGSAAIFRLLKRC